MGALGDVSAVQERAVEGFLGDPTPSIAEDLTDLDGLGAEFGSELVVP